jgi:hypothetical protein
MRKQATVYVVNNSGADFADQFDGEKFLFPAVKAGEEPQATEIPVGGGGAHLRPWASPTRCAAIQRLGWAATTNDMKGALERLGKFAFHLELPNEATRLPRWCLRNPRSARKRPKRATATKRRKSLRRRRGLQETCSTSSQAPAQCARADARAP